MKTSLLFITCLIVLYGCVSFEEPTTCTYNDQTKEYIIKDVSLCKTKDFTCADKERFFDECGCGCLEEEKSVGDRMFCEDDERNVEACAEIYQPVCGWNGPHIQCVRFPCASDYSNRCFACQNADVEYITEGRCPEE